MDPITRFLDLRRLWGGGDVADKVQLKQWTGGNNYADQNITSTSFRPISKASSKGRMC